MVGVKSITVAQTSKNGAVLQPESRYLDACELLPPLPLLKPHCNCWYACRCWSSVLTHSVYFDVFFPWVETTSHELEMKLRIPCPLERRKSDEAAVLGILYVWTLESHCRRVGLQWRNFFSTSFLLAFPIPPALLCLRSKFLGSIQVKYNTH